MKSCQKHDVLPSQDWNEIRRIPSGLDKSWEIRRVEGLEMLSTSLELQKEKEKHSCKAGNCCHNAINKNNHAANKKTCPVKGHEIFSNANQSRTGRIKSGSCSKNNNNLLDAGNCPQIVKCRSLSSSKKNKLSIASSPHKHERSLTCEIFPGVGGSVVGRSNAVVHSESTAENFQMKELEEQVIELIHQLAQEKHQARQDKLNLAKLQQELSRTKSEKPMREILSRQLEQERQRREVLENKLREMSNDCCYCCPNEINVLKKENTRLNEAIQDLLPYKHRNDRIQQNNANSISNLETELSKLKSQLESMEQDNRLMNMEIKKLESIINKCPQCKQQISGLVKLDSAIHSDSTSNNSFKLEKVDDRRLMERIRLLENEKTDLIKENETQFQHYEKCLADVTSQILQALVAQKSLKDECTILKRQLAQTNGENQSLKSILSLDSHTGYVGQNFEVLRNKNLIPERMDDKDYERNLQLTNHLFDKMNADLITNQNSTNTFNDSFLSQSDGQFQDVSSLNGRLSLTNQGGGEGLAEGKTSSSLSLNEILDDVNRTANSDKSNGDQCITSTHFDSETPNNYDIGQTINDSINLASGIDGVEVDIGKKLPLRNSQHSLTTMSQINFRSADIDDNFHARHSRCLPRKSRSVNSGLMHKCNNSNNLTDRSKNILSKFKNNNSSKTNKLHNDSIVTDYSSFSDSYGTINNVISSNNLSSREHSFISDSHAIEGISRANQKTTNNKNITNGSNDENISTVKKRPSKTVFGSEGGKWKNIFPLSCTKPQEEKDDGYLSNKNSEGSYEIAANNISSVSQ